MKDRAWELAWWLIVVAALYVLVRPGSPAGTVIVAFTDLAAGAIGVATGAAFVGSSAPKKGS